MLRYLADAIDFRLVHNRHTALETHPDWSLVGVRDFPGKKYPGREADHLLHPVIRLIMNGAVLPLPQYVFMA